MSKHKLAQAIKLHKNGKHDAAMQIYIEILNKEPENVDALHLLGLVCSHIGDYERSLSLIRKALNLDGESPIIHHNMGTTLRILGDIDQAKIHYRKALELKPDYLECYFNLSAINKFKTVDKAFIAPLLSNLNGPPIKRADACYGHFAAAKYYDDIGEYDRAFNHLQQGSMLNGIKFDKEDYERTLATHMRVADQAFYDKFRAIGIETELPVFIVGMPRSGTTLVEQILTSHPLIHGAGELADIPAISRSISRYTEGDEDYPSCLLGLTPKILQGFGGQYLKKLQGFDPSAVRVIDKNPINHQHLGLILTMFPKARIIHCSRYPLDVCISCYSENFRSGQSFSFSMEGLATFYKGYRSLMAHWQAIAPDRIIEMNYESVVDDLEGEARRLIEFMAVPWDDNCLAFHKTRRPVTTASDVQVRQPIYRSSIRRSDNYARHLGPLREELGEFL